MPSKAIPPARDRLQSRLLVSIVLPLLCASALYLVVKTVLTHGDPHQHFLRAVLTVSTAFALIAWLAKAATPTAAVAGGLICILLTDSASGSPASLSHSGLAPLLLLFVLTFAATRLGYRRKATRGLAEPRSGRRVSQVIANLGVAALCVCRFLLHSHSQSVDVVGQLSYFAAVAALAEATADTVSSEIGQAFEDSAYLMTTLRRVPPGTDGAISLKGTFAGVLGAAAVVYIALPTQAFRLIGFSAIFAAAIAGLFFDSLLGATLERRGYINNDLVNFTSTAFAAAALYPFFVLALSFVHL